MSAKSITIVTASIFGSVFFGIFLSTLIFTENVSSNSQVQTDIEPSNESTNIKQGSSTFTGGSVIPSGLTKSD